MGENRRRDLRIPESIAESLVRRHLERILASATFSNAGRMSRFLRYALEETLAGRAGGLKEYSLGVSVFDRPTDFDPRTEPIVRVEARRLRAKLAAYYEGEGAGDELRIELPKGGYAPLVRRPDAAGVLSAASSTSASAPAAQLQPKTLRLAVLPFSNLGVQGEDEYFSEGLSEELIHVLTKIPALEVIAWGTSTRLRDDDALERVRDRLNAHYLLRGSVRRSANMVRVAVHLIEASKESYVWSEVYERGTGDLLAIEEEIAKAIASKLQMKLHQGGTAHHPSVAAKGSEEHNLYLKGRFHAIKRTEEGLERSLQCYEQAISIRPQYALAHAAIASSLVLLTVYGLRRPLETVPLARRAAERAMDGDSFAQAAALSPLAMITAMHDRRWQEAERLFHRARELDPGLAEAQYWLSVDVLAPLGRFEEAWQHLCGALRVDPLNSVIVEGRGYLRLLERRYDDALAEHFAGMELDPHFHMNHSAVGRLYSIMGRHQEAVIEFQKARHLSGGGHKLDAALGQCLAMCGRKDEALEIRDRLHAAARTGFVPATALAILNLGLGDLEAAVACMETSAENGEFSVTLANVHPIYDPLRSFPRFQSLIQKLNLTPASIR